MTKLSHTQLVVLSAACQRADRNVLPLPANLKGGAAQKVVAGLLTKALVEEATAGPGDLVWRTDEDGTRIKLRATDAAFEALGIELGPEPAHSGDRALATTKRDSKGELGRKAGRAAKKEPKPATPQKGNRGGGAGTAQPRGDTKQAQLIAMLQQPDGAGLDEIVAATGWQVHTVRGAIAGALKKKLGLEIVSQRVEGRGRVYRIGG